MMIAITAKPASTEVTGGKLTRPKYRRRRAGAAHESRFSCFASAQCTREAREPDTVSYLLVAYGSSAISRAFFTASASFR
ncbi:hypothetical protein MTP03_08860 [Tsukamurella sp. PLM1]|nr:hypothetical protein MTP03_08860 [Tsukamurella sp. PLM1]